MRILQARGVLGVSELFSSSRCQSLSFCAGVCIASKSGKHKERKKGGERERERFRDSERVKI